MLPRTTSYYKACAKYFPVLLCTTKLAQGTSQYYFELHWEILLRTTRLAQSTLPYYFVLQSLHKVLPRSTSYYKACTKYFPVLLLSAKLAQIISRYYFALQSLHKILPSSTSYFKACTKGTSHIRHPRAPAARDEVPTIDARSQFLRENAGFGAISTVQTSPWHSSSTAICAPCLANHTTTASSTFLRSTFLLSSHQDSPTSLLSHIPTLSISNFCASLLSPSLISAHPYSHHLQSLHISTLSISNLCTSLRSPSLIYPHLYSLSHPSTSLLSPSPIFAHPYSYVLVIMYCCDYALLWWFIVVMIYCCDWIYCCDCLLLWWCIVVIIYCWD